MARSGSFRDRFGVECLVVGGNASQVEVPRMHEGVLCDSLAFARCIQETDYGLADLVVPSEDSVAASPSDLDGSEIRRCDHRTSGCHRLNIRDPETFVRARKAEHRGAPIQVGKLMVGDPSEYCNAVA